MEQIESIFGLKFGAVLGALFCFGLFYKWLVYHYLPDVKKIKNRTAELVIAGTLVTIIGFGIIIGWDTPVRAYEALIALLVCFGFSGAPMAYGYWSKEAETTAKAEERTASRLQRTSEKARQAVSRMNNE